MPVSVIGGDKWKDALAKYTQDSTVRAGILEGATTEEGEPIAPYAAANEFGTATIPARPFMRRTEQKNQKKWGKIVENALENGATNEQALAQAGAAMKADIVSTIASGMSPESAPSTVRAKIKGNKADPHTTLIDSGAMLKAVEWEPA